ncbi:MAG: hypothetical protein K2L94_02090 [Alphaproteobacteria bacterium]|nr:hypothetical protein [Alphaproteobacteria bacterium]
MTDSDRQNVANISIKYFDNFHQILDRRGRPLTNIYWSRTPIDIPSVGTVYFIHGYGGSPVEPCMKEPMKLALGHGFDVVAIEGVALSATSGAPRKILDMNLARQKLALLRGLGQARALTDLNQSYKVAWVHSISCRALSDLVVMLPEMRCFFDEVILNNPYFLPPSRVFQTQERYMRRDPSGKTWRTLMGRTSMQQRNIENVQYRVPTSLYNLAVPLPAQWQSTAMPVGGLARTMSHFLGDMRLAFVLGTADDMAEYTQNVELYDGLQIPNKELKEIPGANHSFENALDEYRDCSQQILTKIRNRRVRQ